MKFQIEFKKTLSADRADLQLIPSVVACLDIKGGNVSICFWWLFFMVEVIAIPEKKSGVIANTIYLIASFLIMLCILGALFFGGLLLGNYLWFWLHPIHHVMIV